MWGQGKKSGTAKIDTLIGQNTEIIGDVRFKGGLHVDGIIRGNVIAGEDTDAMLMVSEHGRIEGEVRVPNVVLNGSVTGDVYVAERIELATQAKVTGNVYYNLIEMAMGAEVNGNLVHQVATAPAVKPVVDSHKSGAVEPSGKVVQGNS